jgi:hypothetical protein
MLYGSTLVTRDLDVCAVLSRENVAKLRNTLRDLKPINEIDRADRAGWLLIAGHTERGGP